MADNEQKRPVERLNLLDGMPRARATKPKGAKRARISPKLATMLEIMAYEGVSLPLAAERAGMAVSSAKKAMAKPHVKTSFNQLVADIRANAGQAAYLRIVRLSEEATSETVRLEAGKWVAGVDGIAALKKVESRHAVSHTFGGFAFGRRSDPVTTAEVIDHDEE